MPLPGGPRLPKMMGQRSHQAFRRHSQGAARHHRDTFKGHREAAERQRMLARGWYRQQLEQGGRQGGRPASGGLSGSDLETILLSIFAGVLLVVLVAGGLYLATQMRARSSGFPGGNSGPPAGYCSSIPDGFPRPPDCP